MRLDYSPQFLENWNRTPPRVQKLLEKQVQFLLENLRHPSLRAKKYDEARDIWQARVDGRGVFTFKSEATPIIC
jgi:mRNA-degrading endonuclease RelE of RelBE toxin-antitoxin system